MSIYSCTGYGLGAMSIRAGLREIRIIKVVTYSQRTGLLGLAVSRWNSSTLASGNSLPVTPMRKNSPPSSVTSSDGTDFPGGGTSNVLHQYICPSGTSEPIYRSDGSYYYLYTTSSTSFDPPLAVTLLPGDVFRLTGFNADWPTTHTMYFEELRLSGSY